MTSAEIKKEILDILQAIAPDEDLQIASSLTPEVPRCGDVLYSC